MKITPQHEEAALMLSQGMTNKAVAEKLGIAPETVSRWRSEAGFQDIIQQLLDESRDAAKNRIIQLSSKALDTIESVLTSSEASAKDKLTAAFKVIEIIQIEPKEIEKTDTLAIFANVIRSKSAPAPQA